MRNETKEITLDYIDHIPKELVTEIHHILNKRNRLNPVTKELVAELESSEAKHQEFVQENLATLAGVLGALKLVSITVPESIKILTVILADHPEDNNEEGLIS